MSSRRTSSNYRPEPKQENRQNGSASRSASNANGYYPQNYPQNYYAPYGNNSQQNSPYPQNNAQYSGQGQNQQPYGQQPYYPYAAQQYTNYAYPQMAPPKKPIWRLALLFGGAVLLFLVILLILNQKKLDPVPLVKTTLSPAADPTSTNVAAHAAEASPTPLVTAVPSKEVFAKETYIDGVNVGGLTFEEAKNAVNQNSHNLRHSLNIAVNYQGSTVFTVNSSAVGFQMNSDYALNRAWMENKTKNYEGDSVEKSEYSSEKTTLNYAAIDTMLEQVKQHAYIEPKDAAVSGFNPDSEPVFTFQKEVYGRSIDIAAARQEILDLLSNFSSGTVELKSIEIAPKVLLADLNQRYKLLNRSRTPISKESTQQRIDNIRVAFSRFNGMTIKAGKRFSFNRVVGERTFEKGFFEAAEYAYGELAMGIGGGVCQASTTTYLAALKSGLRIRKRVQHSLQVNYTDMGLDATVFLSRDREIDFVFENNTGYDIFISARVIKDPANRRRYMAEVAIYGYAKDNVKYEVVTEQVEILPAPLEPVVLQDKEAKYVTFTDEEHVVQKAKEGYVVDTYLLKYEGDVLVKRERISRDTYKARPERKYVGVTPRY